MAESRRRYVLFLLIIVSIIAYSDRLILGFLIDPIKADLGISDTEAGILSGLAFSLFYAVMGLPLGRAIDIYPRNRVLAACIAAWSVATVFCGLATSSLMLFLARCGVGAGEAAMNPAAASIISDRYPRDKVVGALALYSLGLVGGGGLAILGGGQLIAWLSSLDRIDLPGLADLPVWRAVFLLLGVPGLVAAVIVQLTIRDSRRGPASEGAVERESNKEAASALWAHRRIYGPLFAGLIAYGMYNYSVLGWYPAMFARTFAASPAEIATWYGSAYLVSGIAGALCSGPLVAWLERRGATDAPVVVLLVSALIATAPAVAGPLMPTMGLALACFLLSMFMCAMQNSMALSSLVLVTRPERRGLIVATYVMAMNLTSGSFAAVIVGLLSDHVFGPDRVAYSLALMAALSLPTAAIFYACARRQYRDVISKRTAEIAPVH